MAIIIIINTTDTVMRLGIEAYLYVTKTLRLVFNSNTTGNSIPATFCGRGTTYWEKRMVTLLPLPSYGEVPIYLLIAARRLEFYTVMRPQLIPRFRG